MEQRHVVKLRGPMFHRCSCLGRRCCLGCVCCRGCCEAHLAALAVQVTNGAEQGVGAQDDLGALRPLCAD